MLTFRLTVRQMHFFYQVLAFPFLCIIHKPATNVVLFAWNILNYRLRFSLCFYFKLCICNTLLFLLLISRHFPAINTADSLSNPLKKKISTNERWAEGIEKEEREGVRKSLKRILCLEEWEWAAISQFHLFQPIFRLFMFCGCKYMQKI